MIWHSIQPTAVANVCSMFELLKADAVQTSLWINVGVRMDYLNVKCLAV